MVAREGVPVGGVTAGQTVGADGACGPCAGREGGSGDGVGDLLPDEGGVLAGGRLGGVVKGGDGAVHPDLLGEEAAAEAVVESVDLLGAVEAEDAHEGGARVGV